MRDNIQNFYEKDINIMSVTLEQLSTCMKSSEDEHLEFKEAKKHFDFEKLVRYCVALANEGGGKITQASFNTTDLLVLDFINREQPIPDWGRGRLPVLRKLGVIEKLGRKHILSRRFYSFVGKKGIYTRKRGLDRETNKALLLKHIKDNKQIGSRLQELMDVLPSLSRRQVQNLLSEMKRVGSINLTGQTRAARWYPGTKNDIAPYGNKSVQY